MELNRRDFMKANAALAAAAAAGMTIPVKQVNATEDMGIKWDKAPCRFCGTGCSVLVGTKDGRVVATQGDPDAEVNRGLNCIKGYFLSKIMYGADRVQTPLLRMKDGKFSSFHYHGGKNQRYPEEKRTKCCRDVLFRSNHHL